LRPSATPDSRPPTSVRAGAAHARLRKGRHGTPGSGVAGTARPAQEGPARHARLSRGRHGTPGSAGAGTARPAQEGSARHARLRRGAGNARTGEPRNAAAAHPGRG